MTNKEGAQEIVDFSPFLGSYNHTLDAKGRVSLPAEFRANIPEKKVIVTNYISSGSRVIEGFSVSGWQYFEGKLRAKSRFDPKLQLLENFYLSRACSCDLDSSGRILLPANLRTYASIDKEVTFTSCLNGFRIWNTTVWESLFDEIEQSLLNDPELFAALDT